VENEDSDSIETVEAFQLWDLGVLEIRLLKEFLPAALEKSEDKKYAGFLPHTTSRNSLLERLRDLEIPELSDIETEFENYIERADRKRELERRIGLTERFIDNTVCSLYGLNSENQEVIEKGLQKQED